MSYQVDQVRKDFPSLNSDIAVFPETETVSDFRLVAVPFETTALNIE